MLPPLHPSPPRPDPLRSFSTFSPLVFSRFGLFLSCFAQQWAKGYSRQAAAVDRLKQYDQAIALYQKALELEPDNQVYKDSVRALEEKIAKQAKADAEEQQKRAARLNKPAAHAVSAPVHLSSGSTAAAVTKTAGGSNLWLYALAAAGVAVAAGVVWMKLKK